MQKRLVIDLDGTLCSLSAGGEDYYKASPHNEMIEKVNTYHRAGWHITIFTARGMQTYGNAAAAERAHGLRTRYWLRDNNVAFDTLKFGKPPADLYVDDKGMLPDEFRNT